MKKRKVESDVEQHPTLKRGRARESAALPEAKATICGICHSLLTPAGKCSECTATGAGNLIRRVDWKKGVRKLLAQEEEEERTRDLLEAELVQESDIDPESLASEVDSEADDEEEEPSESEYLFLHSGSESEGEGDSDQSEVESVSREDLLQKKSKKRAGKKTTSDPSAKSRNRSAGKRRRNEKVGASSQSSIDRWLKGETPAER